MIRATSVKAAGDWNGVTADILMLDFDSRNRRTGTLTGMRGTVLDVALDHAATLRTGDAFVAEDGRLFEVVSKPERLLDIKPATDADLAKIAWQLGNHHLPMQITGKRLRIRAAGDIAAVLTGLGAKVTEIEAPFDPEGGAYLAQVALARKGHVHGPDCGCGHDHHDHAHHDHDHHDHAGHSHSAHDHAGHNHAGHVHGPDCGHDHSHDHKHDHGHHHGHKHD